MMFANINVTDETAKINLDDWSIFVVISIRESCLSRRRWLSLPNIYFGNWCIIMKSPVYSHSFPESNDYVPRVQICSELYIK